MDTAVSDERAVQGGEAGDDGFAFSWGRRPRTRGRLFLILMLVTILHVVSFYFFRVVYPEPERVSAMTARVTLLPADDPDLRAVIREIEDRVVYHDAALRETAPPKPDVEATVSYRPSFAGYEPALRPLRPGERALPLPDLPEFQERADEVSQPPTASDQPAASVPAPGSANEPEGGIGSDGAAGSQESGP